MPSVWKSCLKKTRVFTPSVSRPNTDLCLTEHTCFELPEVNSTYVLCQQMVLPHYTLHHLVLITVIKLFGFVPLVHLIIWNYNLTPALKFVTLWESEENIPAVSVGEIIHTFDVKTEFVSVEIHLKGCLLFAGAGWTEGICHRGGRRLRSESSSCHWSLCYQSGGKTRHNNQPLCVCFVFKVHS